MKGKKFWVPFLLAVAVGAIISWIDTRPNWDDTGITAGLIFISTASLSLMNPRYPWLWALAVGVWIPLLSIINQGNYSATLAIILAFFGAYSGWLVQKVIQKRS